MDFILANLKLLIIAIVVIVYVLKAVRGAQSGSGGGSVSSPRGQQSDDAAEDERTRQIQEEIRRRILARQRGETMAPPAQPPPIVVVESPVGPRSAPPPPLPVQRPEADTFPGSQDTRNDEFPGSEAATAVLERQRALEEQLQMVERMRRIATAGVPPLPSARSAPQVVDIGNASRRMIRRELTRGPNLRRAMLLREIVGEPPGLAQPGTPLPRR